MEQLLNRRKPHPCELRLKQIPGEVFNTVLPRRSPNNGAASKRNNAKEHVELLLARGVHEAAGDAPGDGRGLQQAQVAHRHVRAARARVVERVGEDFEERRALHAAVAVLAFGAALVIGRRLLLRIVSLVHRTGSRELFMLAMLTIVIGAAWAAHEIGLSPPLGAFLAGMILGETRFKDDAETDIAPFRAVLLGLFFVSVGLRVDLSVIVPNAGLVAGFVTTALPCCI